MQVDNGSVPERLTNNLPNDMLNAMRIKLSKLNHKNLFAAVLQKKTIKEISQDNNVAYRTVRDWIKAKYSLPLTAFNYFVKVSRIKMRALAPKKIPDFWHNREAGRKGGFARMRLLGNFGTPDGRRKGGFRSIVSHKKTKNSTFQLLKPIQKPKHSLLLAEFMGIIVGDGHLSKYQTSITTNSKTDKEHALFIKKLIRQLFAVLATVKEKINENAVSVVASSRALVNYLHSLGMPIGNKIESHITIPKWIMKNTAFQKAFTRGLFDTDGCIYLDKHKTKKRTYLHMGWTITSYADTLIIDIIKMLRDLGFSPTHKITQKSVFLRKQREIQRYFQEIGTSNPKHLNRYQKFTQIMKR